MYSGQPPPYRHQPPMISATSASKKRGRLSKLFSYDSNTLGPYPNRIPCPNPSSGVGAEPAVAFLANPVGEGEELRRLGAGKTYWTFSKTWEDQGHGGTTKLDVILVKTGEDIVSKVKGFSLQGPRLFWIVSARGAVIDATFCSSSSSITYKGRSEIVSLEGEFVLPQSDDGRSREGSMTAYLLDPFGGRLVCGHIKVLIAAEPVEVTVFSLAEDDENKKTAPASLPSQGASCNSLDENGGAGSPNNGGSGPYTNANNQQQPLHRMSTHSHQSRGNTTMNAHETAEDKIEEPREKLSNSKEHLKDDHEEFEDLKKRFKAQERIIQAQRELLQEKDDIILELKIGLKTVGCEGCSSGTARNKLP